MPSTDDVKLAIEASKGNTDAFERLVELYFTGIVGVCYSVTGNAQDAEDCAQDAFVKAYRNIGRYDASASFFTWIYRIALNTCYDLKRKQNRTQSFSIDEAIDSDDGVLFLQLEDTGDLPDQQMIKQISDSRIQEIIDSLPEKYSRILRLKDIEGMSYQEIAKIENIKEGTVKSRLARARVAFARIALKEDLYE